MLFSVVPSEMEPRQVAKSSRSSKSEPSVLEDALERDTETWEHISASASRIADAHERLAVAFERIAVVMEKAHGT